MLEVRNLMVFYENALVVNDFSMDVVEGQVRGVIGSNSAGKTTLMNAISGLLIDRRTKENRRGGERITIMGSIRFLGEEILEERPCDRVPKGIVLCRERHPIFPESDVMENMKIAGYLRSRKEVMETVDFAFKLFPNLEKYKSKKAGFLSGGEQQMLAIGMALAARPKLLLLDEPLLGLSPLMQKHLVESVVRIRADLGVTTVIAEQFARPILPILDYAYVIENGMSTLSGDGPELMENPEVRAAYFGI
jgi:branched-chain amino acid transport system ATP-binding protein